MAKHRVRDTKPRYVRRLSEERNRGREEDNEGLAFNVHERGFSKAIGGLTNATWRAVLSKRSPGKVAANSGAFSRDS